MKTKTTAQSVVIEPVANGVIVRPGRNSLVEGLAAESMDINVFNDFEGLCEFLQWQFVERQS